MDKIEQTIRLQKKIDNLKKIQDSVIESMSEQMKQDLKEKNASSNE